MTKIVKMSLAAAVAVAGFNSTASATDLSEAIKGVDVSGQVRYRYTNTATDDTTAATGTTRPASTTSSTTHAYKITTTVKAPVNDMVTAKVKLEGEDTTQDSTGDADPDLTKVEQANFIVNTGFATVIAGKQDLVTPFAAAGDQEGTGIVALVPAGPVTIAGGWYDNSDAASIYSSATGTDDIGGNNITALAVIGAAGPVDYSLWYAEVSESALNYTDINGLGGYEAGARAINANVAANLGMVSLELNHADVDYSLNDAAKTYAGLVELTQTQTRLVAGLTAGPADITFAIVKTGDEGGNVGLGDGDESANYVGESLSPNALADADLYKLDVAVAVTDKVTVGAYYYAGDGYMESQITGKIDATTTNEKREDVSEFQLNAAYKMSKNFKVSGFYNVYTVDYEAGEGTALGTDGANAGDVEEKIARVELKYTF